MNTHKIDCFDTASIDKALDMVKDLKADIMGAKMMKLLTELGNQGVSYAQNRFGSAQYDGVNDVTVEMPVALIHYTQNGASVTLTATGQAVLFIEYGTGVYYGDDAAVRAALEPGSGVLGRGEYGKGKGKQQGWYYYDRITGEKSYTHGNRSNGCMYETQKYLEAKIVSIAKEVFR